MFSALSVNGQDAIRKADPDPSEISAQEGQKIDLLCRFPKAVLSCNFRIPGESGELKLNPSWSRNDNFRYFGRGLENGDCGVSILNVQEKMHGLASCRLDLNDGMADAVANISIVIARAPQDPQIQFESDSSYFREDDNVEVTCTSTDGRPAANISWFLDEKFFGTGSVEVIDSDIYSTAVSTLQFRVKPEYNNKRLICKTEHVGFPDGSRSTSHQLVVNFRPIPLSDTHIQGLEIGSSAVIGPVTIQANPAPKIMWVIDGKVMNQGEQNEKFIVREPVNIGGSRYNASLQVVSLSLEDTTRSYKLRATNALGTTDYVVRIGGSQEAAGEFRVFKYFLMMLSVF